MKNQLLSAFALFLALGALAPLRAELRTFTIDPSRSSITLSGTASGAELQEQASGSLVTTFEGTVVVDVSPTEVRFPGGSRIKPQELHSWAPGPKGVDGSALASYGGKAQIGSGFFSISAVAATRRLSFEALSSPLALQGGNFNADGLQFQFVETNNPVLDYRTTGLTSLRNGLLLSGFATNKIAGVSTLVTQGDLETLTLQVNATYLFQLLLPDDSALTLKGQVVATRSTSAVPPNIIVGPIAPGESMTLSWPVGFKLQRTTSLLNPIWSDTGAASPATIPFTQDGEYFQVVPQ